MPLHRRVSLIAGENDGVQKCWLNGELVFEAHDLIYRTKSGRDKLIGAMHWHNYHGGRTPEWAPSHNQNIWYAVFSMCGVQV